MLAPLSGAIRGGFDMRNVVVVVVVCVTDKLVLETRNRPSLFAHHNSLLCLARFTRAYKLLCNYLAYKSLFHMSAGFNSNALFGGFLRERAIEAGLQFAFEAL